MRFKVGDKVQVNSSAVSPCVEGMVGVVKEDDGEDSEPRWRVEFGPEICWCYSYELLKASAAGGTTARVRTLPEDSDARKQYPLFTGPMLYFPAALAAVAKLCKDGNDKHNPGEPMHHARGKSTDHEDTILRHLLDAREGNGRDAQGTPHVVNAAWRALAHAQEWLEKHDGAPRAPAASKEGSK